MRLTRLLIASIAALIMVPSIASAAPFTTPNFNFPNVVQPGNQYAIITAGMGTTTIGITFAGTFCAAGCTGLLAAANGVAPQVLLAVIPLSTTVNTGTVTCYDSYNSIAGIPILTIVTAPVQNGTIDLNPPAGGIALSNGLTCVTSTAAVTANGIMFVYR